MKKPIPALDLANVTDVIKTVQQNYAVFGNKEIGRTLSVYTNDSGILQELCEQIKSHSTIMFLGIGADDEEKYTSTRYFELETTIHHCTDTLKNRRGKAISKAFITEELSVYEEYYALSLTQEQQEAVAHLMKPEKISCVIGRAGSGKSFTLGAARHIWQKLGITVQGITLSGIAAVNLEKESNIPSRTIASFKYALLSSQITLYKNDVVVMDEAGMTDSESMAYILDEIQKANAKIVLVGDPEQLQPIGSGPIFQSILQNTGFTEINRIYRQVELWQRQATKNLSLGKIDVALKAYDKHNCINFNKSLTEAKQGVVSRWVELQKENDLSEILVLAHRNTDVWELNQLIRQHRLDANQIEVGILIQTETAEIYLSEHDRILFTQNNKTMNVKNGQFGTIKSITENNIMVKTDTGRLVEFNPIEYAYFAQGYAATIHKAQGVTVNHSLVFVAGAYWDKHLAYVALSRHKESCHVFADKKTYKNIDGLSARLGRSPRKESVLDFPKQPKVIAQEILTDLLKNYVDYQLEQKKLTYLIATTKLGALEDSKKYYTQYGENKLKIKSCIQEIIQHPDVQENTQVIKLSERGGYDAIAERISKNEFESEDVLALVADVRGKR
ncbi:MAG TPA: AAA family ATPase [Gammaproteobacteria bacterium]|nr:AAA family ATPase [Gammaproteobacteria bacterium]